VQPTSLERRWLGSVKSANTAVHVLLEPGTLIALGYKGVRVGLGENLRPSSASTTAASGGQRRRSETRTRS
jgi:hypothetical protein